MIRLAVAGAMGRMGRCVVELASADARFEVVAKRERGDRATLPACDVLVDFTDAGGTAEWLEVCRQRHMAMVIGATGHEEVLQRRIVDAASIIPIVKAANFSVGVNTILKLIGKLATELGSGYDIEIVETHHRNKADAPSGTALALADALRKPSRDRRGDQGGSVVPKAPATSGGLGQGEGPGLIHGRQGKTGIRPVGEIGIHAVRMGDVVGQHEVHFSGTGETVTIKHVAQSRTMFAVGALRAAEWVVGKPAGLYGMGNVIE